MSVRIDKNQAVIDYLIQCPDILSSPLFFNFINAKNDTTQIVTQATERYASRRYVDGSVMKIYSFTLIIFKSVADTAVVKLDGYPNENIDDMSAIQSLIDWVTQQDRLHNYPDFGEDCQVDSVSTTTDTPNFDGINDQISPPLAIYSVTIEIQYLDNSEKIWG